MNALLSYTLLNWIHLHYCSGHNFCLVLFYNWLYLNKYYDYAANNKKDEYRISSEVDSPESSLSLNFYHGLYSLIWDTFNISQLFLPCIKSNADSVEDPRERTFVWNIPLSWIIHLWFCLIDSPTKLRLVRNIIS